MAAFDKRLFSWLFISFIGATIIGTLSHECGHYLVAKCLGYDAHINYYSTHFTKSNPNQIENSADWVWIWIGGPAETMLTGTIGFVLLFLFRKSFHNAKQLSFSQWILVFVSLFWLRQSANLFTWIGSYFITGKFSGRSDEIILARYFQISDWTISTFTAAIGLIVLAVVIFKFIPKKQRLTFIASGLAGGITGYVLWLVLFGKYIMP